MDILSPTFPNGSATPAAEPADDFFSSWDKPSIKRPSNPPSRTQTPPVISRTASPFLNANSGARANTPVSGGEGESSTQPATRTTTSSSALRKTATAGGPRKANVLGAKKNQKLGAKKVVGAEAIDFEAAEKKAKEEAERIEKLGYDPDAEEPVAEATVKSPIDKPKIASPTPISPPKVGYGPQAKGHQRSPSELERLGMGMGRLGFGQVGSNKPAAAAPKKMGFGAVGSSKAVEEGTSSPQPSEHVILTRRQTMMRSMRVRNSAIKRVSLRTSSLAKAPSTRMPPQRPRPACKVLKEQPRSRAMHTLAGRRKTRRPRIMLITVTSRAQQGTLFANLVSRRRMIWRI